MSADRLAGIAGDLTALVLTTNHTHRTAEEIHGEVVRIMARHTEAIRTPDREKALAWCRVLVLPPLPEIESAAIREAMELTVTDIRHRVSVLEREMNDTTNEEE
jgi:hypothetical protein